jgi:hypothetical protein
MLLGPFLPARDGCLLSRPLRPNYPIFNHKENNEDSTDGPSLRIVEHTVGAWPFLPPRDGCLLSRPLRLNYPVSDPPARFISNDRENNEDTTDGPTPHIVEHTVCARPFVAPSRSLFEEYVCNLLAYDPSENILYIAGRGHLLARPCLLDICPKFTE